MTLLESYHPSLSPFLDMYCSVISFQCLFTNPTFSHNYRGCSTSSIITPLGSLKEASFMPPSNCSGSRSKITPFSLNSQRGKIRPLLTLQALLSIQTENIILCGIVPITQEVVCISFDTLLSILKSSQFKSIKHISCPQLILAEAEEARSQPSPPKLHTLSKRKTSTPPISLRLPSPKKRREHAQNKEVYYVLNLYSQSIRQIKWL